MTMERWFTVYIGLFKVFPGMLKNIKQMKTKSKQTITAKQMTKITLAHRMLIILKLPSKDLFLSVGRDENFVFIRCRSFIRLGSSAT